MTTRRRALLARWLLPIAAVGILVAVVALAGGFRTAEGVAGAPAQPGEQIDLARWEITVNEVELTNVSTIGVPTDTNLRVHLTVTLTGEESQHSLPIGLLTVEVPDGSPTDIGYGAGGEWMTAIDPDITRSYVVDFTWPLPEDDGEQPPVVEVPQAVTVVVHDEIYAEGALFGWSWGVDDVAAVVTVPVADTRVEEEA